MNLPNPITKAELDQLEEKYPKSMKVFKEWVDEYKKAVDWIGLFDPYAGSHGGGNNHAPKYHDLPQAMQLGIWVEFVRQREISTGAKYKRLDVQQLLLNNIEFYFHKVLEPSL